MQREDARREKPGRRHSRAVLTSEMEAKGITQVILAEAIGKSTGALSRAIKDDTTGEATFEEYLRDIIPHLGYGCLDEFYDAVRLRTTGGIPGADYCIDVGETRTLWYAATRTYERGSEGRADDYVLTLNVDQELRLDPELSRAVQQTKAERQAGKWHFENGELLHFAQAQWRPPVGPEERHVLRGTLVPHEYATFFTLNSTPHGRELLHERLRRWKRAEIIPELAGGVGINVAIATTAGEFVLGRRAAAIAGAPAGPRPEQLDVGAVEGLHKVKDIEPRGLQVATGAHWDMTFTAQRALREEYGIRPGDIAALRFLGFGVDLQYSQWNILALAVTRLNGEEIRRRNRRAIDGEEFLETFAVGGGPRAVFERMALERRQIWSCGVALAYFAMINLHGEDNTERAIEGLDLRRLDQMP